MHSQVTSLPDYKDFKALAYSSLEDVQDWQTIKSKFHGENSSFYVATTISSSGKEILAACCALKRHEEFSGEILLDNAYQGTVSLQFFPKF